MANLNGHHYQLQSQGIHYYIHENKMSSKTAFQNIFFCLMENLFDERYKKFAHPFFNKK